MPVPRSELAPAPTSSGDSPHAAVITIFGTLATFKVATAIWIFTLQPSSHSAAFLTLTSVFWFPVVAIVLVLLLLGGIFWYRRLRVRAKRHRLIEAEWRDDERVAARS